MRRCNVELRKPARLRFWLRAAPLLLVILIVGCATRDPSSQSGGAATGGVIVPSNFDQALRDNQKLLVENKAQSDIALYNIGVLLAHSANPKKDYLRAMSAFKSLVKNHPASPRAEPAKIWIAALEQYQQTLEDSQKMAEDKRSLLRERDQLAQERNQLTLERNKVNYAIEKSRQLDAEIEMRRKQSLKR